MAGRDADTVAALGAQADALMAVFGRAGYVRVAPEVLQPADLFFDRSGEEIRGRTYVFTDLDGAELCLRPDLTIPTCRLHVETGADPGAEARYCYLGSAFRYQPGGETAANPREFEQAGIENFGAADRERAEAGVLALTLEAVAAAGLKHYGVRIGDLGLLAGLVDGIDMPERWRNRLKQHFWRPQAFRRVLAEIQGKAPPRANGGHLALLERLAGRSGADAVAILDETLCEMGAPLVGGRSLEEIARRLLEQAADLEAKPLDPALAALIERYTAIEGPPREALAAIESIAREAGSAMERPLAAFARRLDLAAEAGAGLGEAVFSAVFGRNLEYYTGFVFQLERPERGQAGRIAGGGRYDTLLQATGAPEPVPAVGCAIHTERLLAAVREGA